MSATQSADIARISWIVSDHARFQRDRDEIEADWPGLHWADGDAGYWEGTLPLWPFDRDTPEGLDLLTGGVSLETTVMYSEAYPMVAPTIIPLTPLPEVAEWTMHRWHVNGDGSLCLLQSHSAWDPRASITELLLKAAGWRIEYALMKAGVIETMTLNGIVSDSGLDELITEAACTIGGTG